MDRTTSDFKLFETIQGAAKGEATAVPAASVKSHAASAAANTHERPGDRWLLKAPEPGCFLAGRWLG